MKLSTKGRYGTRLMVDLARHYGAGPILLKDIAERQQVSKKYLEQLIIRLKAHGLVSSVRGAKGGYILSRPPSEIRLIDIFETLEGPPHLVKCVADAESCSLASTCVTREVWTKLSEDISQRLNSITLDSLLRNQKVEKG